MAKQKINYLQQGTNILGYSSTNTAVNVAGNLVTILSVSIDVTQAMVDSGRKLRVTCFIPQMHNASAGGRVRVDIYSNITLIGRAYHNTGAAGEGTPVHIVSPAIAMPSVGNKTITVQGVRDVGSGNINAYADANATMWMEVEIV